MKGNLINSIVSSSNLTIDGEIEFSVHPSNQLLPSPCIISKKTHYLPSQWTEQAQEKDLYRCYFLIKLKKSHKWPSENTTFLSFVLKKLR